MDIMKIVSRKLIPNDKCVAFIKGSYLDDTEKCPSILTLVENVEGHCLFLYILVKSSSGSLNDIELFKVIEVDLNFKYSHNAPPTRLNVSNSKQSLTFELSNASDLVSYVNELERAKQIHSQNAVFTSPSFSWVDKYLFSPVPTFNPDNNPASAGQPCRESLIRFEDTTVVSALDQGDGWPFNKIIQLESGKPCPVVKDSSTNQSNNSLRTNGKTNTLDYMPRSNSRDKLKDKSDSMKNYSSVTRRELGSPNMTSRETIALLLMRQRETEYTSLQNYRVFIGTWNVNGQQASVELTDWLATENERRNPPDIYAIGLQEMDLSKNLYIMGESVRETEWIARIEQALSLVSPGVNYVKVQSVRLIAILLVVYVKETVKGLADVMAESAPTGFFGVMGNKGGVAVRLKLQDATLCFVNSHLCAHTDEWMRRNQDYKDINAKLLFRPSPNRYHTISDHDMVFWFGDLNYRISDIEAEECKSYINNNKLDELFNFDQLVRQMTMKRVFLDFKEGPLNFKPTYKFDPGTDNWDTDKVRAPAWCDRVLWKGDNIKQEVYRSHAKLTISDHKPVSAVFIAGTKVINSEKERVIREQVMKQLDKEENEYLPKANLNVRQVSFKDLKYLDTQQRSVTLTNIGRVLVQFEFVCKSEDLHPFKPWLQAQPPDGFLPPGESVNIQLEVQVNSKTVQDWQNCQIEDNLVLQLQGGQSLFLPISGTRKPSCFGLPLTTLIKIFLPVADSLDENFKLKYRSGEAERPLDIPKELWFLVDYLFNHGMLQVDLFQILGIEEEIKEIRDILDSSTKGLQKLGHELQIHSVAETLLIFLDSLPESVIPRSFYDRCLESQSLKQCNEILERVPACHRNVFKYICAFLKEFIASTYKNSSDVRVLAHIFGAVLLKPPESTTTYASMTMSAEENNRKATFIQRFIQSDRD